MSSPPEKIVCPECSTEYASSAPACPKCRPPSLLRATLDNEFLYRPQVLLGVLFLATGALGLPLLWRAPTFSTPMKWLISVALVLYSASAFWVVGLALWWFYQEMLKYWPS